MGDRAGGRQFSIKNKILVLTGTVALPFLLMVVYLLGSMANYSRTYDKIVSNLTVANNYNLNFKEEMDESLYKFVVGYVTFENISGNEDAGYAQMEDISGERGTEYVTFENISEEETLKNPYVLIDGLRSEFTELMSITTEAESKVWLQSLLRNIDTLEDRVDDIVESVAAGGMYDENIEKLDNNIYILTELIQDDIQYYIYYQTRSMEEINSSLNHQIKNFIILCSGIMLVLTAAVAVAVILIVSGILRPVRELYHATERVAEGDFDARAEVDSNDELAVLADGFNYMAGNMQSMIGKIKEDEQKMRRADLRLLQEQINPHFLYNTLDTIVWLIEGNEAEQAVDMVVTLSSFFRQVLSKGKEFISIKEEEQHISSYLKIQEMRYHDILEYQIEIDSSLYGCQIPKLTLQPLVENALYHGIKYKRAKGFIYVGGEKEGDAVRLTVKDDGAGMEPEELSQLREEINRPCKETKKGFGLANVNERIRMYFGAEYGVAVDSEKGKGTTVEILIPAVWAEEK